MKIVVGDYIKKEGWGEWYLVKYVDESCDTLFIMVDGGEWTYSLRPLYQWIIKERESIDPADIDHFEYDGFRLPKFGEWFGEWYCNEAMNRYHFSINKSLIDFTNNPQHIYRPVRKVVPASTTPLTDKFEEEGW